jgi:hypothetical protein
MMNETSRARTRVSQPTAAVPEAIRNTSVKRIVIAALTVGRAAHIPPPTSATTICNETSMPVTA